MRVSDSACARFRFGSIDLESWNLGGSKITSIVTNLKILQKFKDHELLTLLRFDLNYLKCISNHSNDFDSFEIIPMHIQKRPRGNYFRYGDF